MISLAGLITLGVSLFTSMAIGTISVVLVSVIGSLTFLPATLAILGDRVNRGRPATWLPWLASNLPIGPVRRWGRSALAWLDWRGARRTRAAASGRRSSTGSWPGRSSMTIASVLVLLVLASPVLRLRTGITDITGVPRLDRRGRRDQAAQREVAAGHRARRSTSSSRTPTGRTRRRRSRTLKTEGLKLAGLSEPVRVTPSRDGQVALVSFTMAGSQNDEVNRRLVREARSQLDAGRLRRAVRRPGAT